MLVALDIRAHRFIDDRVGDEQFRLFVVLDLLHPSIKLGALGLVGNGPRLGEQVVELRVAPLRDVIAGRLAVRAAEQEEEVVRVAVVARPAHLAGVVLGVLQALAVLAPLEGDELGVDADLGEVGLHHLADALAVRVVGALHRLIPEVDVERRLDAGRGEHRLGLLGIVGKVDDLVVIGPHRRRDQRLGFLACAQVDVLDDRIAIDRHRQRHAHVLVIERRLGHVERPVGDVEAGLVDDFQRRVLLHLGDVGRPRIAVDVALARLELGVARRVVGGDGEDEIVDQRLLAKIMVGILLEADHRVLLIGDEIERAGADRNLVELLGRPLLQQEVGVFS